MPLTLRGGGRRPRAHVQGARTALLLLQHSKHPCGRAQAEAARRRAEEAARRKKAEAILAAQVEQARNKELPFSVKARWVGMQQGGQQQQEQQQRVPLGSSATTSLLRQGAWWDAARRTQGGSSSSSTFAWGRQRPAPTSGSLVGAPPHVRRVVKRGPGRAAWAVRGPGRAACALRARAALLAQIGNREMAPFIVWGGLGLLALGALKVRRA